MQRIRSFFLPVACFLGGLFYCYEAWFAFDPIFRSSRDAFMGPLLLLLGMGWLVGAALNALKVGFVPPMIGVLSVVFAIGFFLVCSISTTVGARVFGSRVVVGKVEKMQVFEWGNSHDHELALQVRLDVGPLEQIRIRRSSGVEESAEQCLRRHGRISLTLTRALSQPLEAHCVPDDFVMKGNEILSQGLGLHVADVGSWKRTSAEANIVHDLVFVDETGTTKLDVRRFTPDPDLSLAQRAAHKGGEVRDVKVAGIVAKNVRYTLAASPKEVFRFEDTVFDLEGTEITFSCVARADRSPEALHATCASIVDRLETSKRGH